MTEEIERNLGEQPIAGIMDELGLKHHDLVEVSKEHLTHKMVARARKGRRLTDNIQLKVLNALNKCSEKKQFVKKDLFNY